MPTVCLLKMRYVHAVSMSLVVQDRGAMTWWTVR